MTAAEYKFVYFSPDPFVGSKIPVAALIRTSRGVRAVAPTVPLNAASVGGRDVEFLIRAAMRNLERSTSLEQLPLSLGPHFTLASDVRTIPSKIDEPDAWLASILSAPPAARNKRQPRVATEGRRLFQDLGVSHFVGDHFRPKADVLPSFAERLEPITHYVLGRELLLLEPIPVTAQKERLIQINTRFGAYRHALEKQPPGFPWRLISYVLPPKDAKKSASASLATRMEFADAVLNTSDPGQRDTLVHKIQHAATA